MRPDLFHCLDLLPETPVSVAAADDAVDDGSLVERIVAAYRQSSAALPDLGGPIWSGIAGKSRDVHDAMVTEDLPAVARFLRYPHLSNLLYGFEMVCADFHPEVTDNPALGMLQARWAHDSLVRLAETIGAIRTRLPEVDFQDRPWQPDALVTAIADTLACPLRFPCTIPGEHGCASRMGGISHRAVQALYQAWRLGQVTAFAGGGRVVEIGAGLGRTAFFSSLLGLTDYTIVDLPLTNAAQAYFLGRALGADRVVLHGEPDHGGACVRIESPTWFHGGREAFDVALNADSMTEIGVDQAERYWRELARRSAVFVSMNHEAQSFRVADLPVRCGTPVHTLRSICPLRKGYVEELFFFAPHTKRRAA